MFKKIFISLLVVILGGLIVWLIWFDGNDKKALDDNKDIKQADIDNGKVENKREKDENSENSDNSSLNKYTFESQSGDTVEIKANKQVSATGFAGASNHVFYLKGSKLHYMNLGTGLDEVIAENITDIYLDGEDVVAVLDKNGKVLKENNYITYK